VTIQYGSGSVEGTLARDAVSMAGFTVLQQTFLSVDQTTDGIFDGSITGFLGLAFQSLAVTQAVPFWQALVNNNLFASPEMSFWLTRYLNDTNAQTDEPGGILTLGGANTTLYSGNIEFLNMSSSSTQSYWLLEMSSVSVQGKNVQISTGAMSAIDTGTTLIGGPSADVQNIWAAVPGSQPMEGDMQGYYSFPCNTEVQISLSFGGSSWPISPADMNLGPSSGASDQECLGGIFDLGAASSGTGGGGTPSWIVGDTFLKNVYTVLRSSPPSIGFAQLSAAAGSSSGGGSSSTSPTAHASLATSLLPTGTSTSLDSGAASFRITSIIPLPASLLLTLVAGLVVLC
jgi:cathepsin D